MLKKKQTNKKTIPQNNTKVNNYLVISTNVLITIITIIIFNSFNYVVFFNVYKTIL